MNELNLDHSDKIEDWLAEGIALQAAGDLAGARAMYEAGLVRDPDNAAPYHLLGVILQSERRFADAHRMITLALARAPDSSQAFTHRGFVAMELGWVDEAIVDLRLALMLEKGQFRPAQIALAKCWNLLGQTDKALTEVDEILSVDPTDIEARVLRSDYTIRLFQHEKCLADTEQLLGVPGDALERASTSVASLHCRRAEALRMLRRESEAREAYRDALAAAGNDRRWLMARASALAGLDHMEEALEAITQRLVDAPNDGHARQLRAALLAFLDDRDGALDEIARAEALPVRHADLRFIRGLILLSRGHFGPGWREYEGRFEARDALRPEKQYRRPAWTGRESLIGKSLLVVFEQGFGDTLQFCRFAPQLAKRGGTVALLVQKGLRAVMGGLATSATLYEPGDIGPQPDMVIAMLSVPQALGIRLNTIPADPYLSAPEDRLEAMRSFMGPRLCGRIGIAWAGNPQHAFDRFRSVNVAAMLAAMPANVELWCLQPDVTEADMAVLKADPRVRFAELRDFGETAAVIANVDLVVSVDTSVAHLAGGMGAEVWTLLTVSPDWRWLIDREDSPWYPTMRLFRQSGTRDWMPVLQRIAFELSKRFGSALA